MVHITDKLKDKKWGVMVHLLHYLQNNPDRSNNEGVGKSTWNEVIAQIDVNNIAKELSEMGAGYLLITMQQGNQNMSAPNATFDAITGYRHGEACAERDLFMDLYNALQAYGIDLYLYFTGDGPYQDEKAGTAMGAYGTFTKDSTTPTFLKNWQAVLQEYAVRYAGKVQGWWIDGCYEYFGYTDDKLKGYYDVLKGADKNYLITFNDGFAIDQKYSNAPNLHLRKYSKWEDYTSGEAVDIDIYPPARFIDGSQWHILLTLSNTPEGHNDWGGENVRWTEEEFLSYIQAVWNQGGVLTLDMGLKRSGKFFDKQKQFIQTVMQKAAQA
ncbi:MAG: alpha-L-fucosidase [Clostridia bacterium]|nr:alpha-L-fucosidase [Clostridia bacterium]